MPLLGSAAMLLGFDVVPEAMAEHDRRHTHEHMPERLSIPGFLRGTRWCALRGAPHYMVLYEVESLEQGILRGGDPTAAFGAAGPPQSPRRGKATADTPRAVRA